MSTMLIPVMGFLAGVFTPLPTLLFYYRWGSPLGYAIPGGSALAGSVILSLLNMTLSIPFFLELLYLGLFLGLGMRKQWSAEKTIGAASLFIFVLGALTFFVLHGGADAELVKRLEDGFRKAISLALQQYGVSSAEKLMVEEALHQTVPLIVRLLPGAALSSALVISWLNVLMTKRYNRLRGLPLPPWNEWSLWKAPEPLVWAAIAAGVMLLLPSNVARMGALNALIVFGTVYLFQGLSIMTFYFEKWKLPRLLRTVLFGFVLLQQFATIGAILMGLFDMWLDFRRLSREPD